MLGKTVENLKKIPAELYTPTGASLYSSAGLRASAYRLLDSNKQQLTPK